MSPDISGPPLLLRGPRGPGGLPLPTYLVPCAGQGYSVTHLQPCFLPTWRGRETTVIRHVYGDFGTNVLKDHGMNNRGKQTRGPLPTTTDQSSEILLTDEDRMTFKSVLDRQADSYSPAGRSHDFAGFLDS